jgi:hypothetical protein
MVNAKNKTNNYFFVIGGILTAYLIYLLIDRATFNTQETQAIINGHSQNLSNPQKIENLILGGSNSYFSISAELMTHKTNSNWYNLSILNEGFNFKNYFEFIKKSIKKENRSNIKTIIYSSLTPLTKNELARRVSSNKNIDGSSDISFKPGESLARKLVRLNQKAEFASPSPPNSYGDMDFKKMICPGYYGPTEFWRGDVKNSSKFFSKIAISLSEEFINSKIIISLPAVYYGKNYSKKIDYSFYKEFTKLIHEEVLRFRPPAADRIFVIQEPPILSTDLICDKSQVHTNAAGRLQRTQKMLALL